MPFISSVERIKRMCDKAVSTVSPNRLRWDRNPRDEGAHSIAERLVDIFARVLEWLEAPIQSDFAVVYNGPKLRICQFAS